MAGGIFLDAVFGVPGGNGMQDPDWFSLTAKSRYEQPTNQLKTWPLSLERCKAQARTQWQSSMTSRRWMVNRVSAATLSSCRMFIWVQDEHAPGVKSRPANMELLSYRLQTIAVFVSSQGSKLVPNNIIILERQRICSTILGQISHCAWGLSWNFVSRIAGIVPKDLSLFGI